MKQPPLCDDKAALIAYLYGECAEDERRRIAAHLATCAACAREVRELGTVRGALREWSPPEQALGFRIMRESELTVSGARPPAPPRRLVSRWFPPAPAWAQLAAAVLVLAVGAAIANLNVSIGNGGVTIRTGWQRPVEVRQAAQAPAPAQAAAPQAPWRADLAALEQHLRAEISAIPSQTAVTPVPAALSAGDRAALIRQLQPDLESIGERLQRQVDAQMAARFVRFSRDMDMQRISDQQRILQGINQIDARTAQLSRVQTIMLQGR